MLKKLNLKITAGTIKIDKDFEIEFVASESCFIWKSGIELTFLNGFSGIGKTTIMNLCYNYLKRKENTSLATIKFEASLNLDNSFTVYVPQNPPMVNHWQIKKLLPMNPCFKEVFFPKEPQSLLSKRLGECSGGQKLRIYTWSALERLKAEDKFEGFFLLLDETLDGLGNDKMYECLRSIMDVWRKLVRKPLYILIASHLYKNECSSILQSSQLKLEKTNNLSSVCVRMFNQ